MYFVFMLMNVKYLWCIVGAGGTIIVIIWNIFNIEPVHGGGGCLIQKQNKFVELLFILKVWQEVVAWITE